MSLRLGNGRIRVFFLDKTFVSHSKNNIIYETAEIPTVGVLFEKRKKKIEIGIWLEDLLNGIYLHNVVTPTAISQSHSMNHLVMKIMKNEKYFSYFFLSHLTKKKHTHQITYGFGFLCSSFHYCYLNWITNIFLSRFELRTLRFDSILNSFLFFFFEFIAQKLLLPFFREFGAKIKFDQKWNNENWSGNFIFIFR